MAHEGIRVGIVGAGGNTRLMHVPGLRAIPGVSIEAVCNRTRASGEKAAHELGIPRVHERWEDLVTDPGIDAVLIGTWPYLHCPCTLAALQAGKHVLCEARMAMNAREAWQMLECSRALTQLVVMVVPAPYTLEVDRTVKRLVDDGFLGSLLSVDVRGTTGAFIDRASPMQWRQDARLSGLNVLSLGIWYETASRWVGHARSVQAMARTFVDSRIDPETGAAAPVSVPDHVDVLASMENGSQMRLQVSAVTGLAPVTMEAWLYGSEGTLRIDASQKRVYGGRRGESGLREIPIPPEERIGWRVEEEFVGAVRGTEQVRRTTFEEGVCSMEFTDAVAKAASRGVTIPVPPGPA